MGLTVTPLEPEGLSDVKLLSQMCGKMNLPPSRFSSGLWALMYIASLTPFGTKKGHGPIFSQSPSRLHDLGSPDEYGVTPHY